MSVKCRNYDLSPIFLKVRNRHQTRISPSFAKRVEESKEDEAEQKATILIYFYPEVTVEKVSIYRQKQ